MNTDQNHVISSPIQDYLNNLLAKYAGLNEGTVADYIPELATANSEWFGICIATPDGQIYEVGDTRQSFTIQSISKPFTYGIALEDRGLMAVLSKIGVEPSGDAFNSISLDPNSHRPVNPMINAGAIATTGLIKGKSQKDKLRGIINAFSNYVGHDVKIDEKVYRSERTTGHRNRAIGYMLRNFDIISSDPNPVLELYFQQCSILVDCRDLAVMAATLANGGLNPLTGRRAVKNEYVENILSVMGTCGMYDYAGEWIYRVGMPAKSGVGGGILAVLPGRLGIGVFSPCLDVHGNSVRGIKVCNDLSRDLELHLFNVPQTSTSVIRSKYDASQVNSKRIRGSDEAGVLDTYGSQIKVFELQGELMFGSTEFVIREIVQASDCMDYAIIDFKRVLGIDDGACELFLQLYRKMAEHDIYLIFGDVEPVSSLRDFMNKKLTKKERKKFMIFDDTDLALEWCENGLIASKKNYDLLRKSYRLVRMSFVAV